MLLLNGIIAFIGAIIGYSVWQAKGTFDLEGTPLITLIFFALWIFLFLSDVIEDALIKQFNPPE